MSSEERKFALAGEGGGGALPKGLSLFRFILFSFLMMGAVYGGAALYFNAPPRAGDVPPHGVPAAQWEPCPGWMPNFIALKSRIGVRREADGYHFTGPGGYALYGSATILFGILMFGAIGWFLGERIRREMVRRRGL